MASTQRLHHTPDTPSAQAQMTDSDIKSKLEGYKELRNFELLQVGDRVRYFVNSEFRSGGVVKFVKYPVYFVVANYKKNVSWSVQMKEPTLKVFRKTLDQVKKDNKEMREVYAEYKRKQRKASSKSPSKGRT